MVEIKTAIQKANNHCYMRDEYIHGNGNVTIHLIGALPLELECVSTYADNSDTLKEQNCGDARVSSVTSVLEGTLVKLRCKGGLA